MKAKLIKKDEHYFLEVEPYTLSNLQRHTIIANTFDKPKGHILQLSLKNCQAIERGYGLNEIKEIDLSWQDKPILDIEYITRSLKQTEWDVEIVEEPADLAFYESGNRFPIDANLPDRFKYKPKLDAENCLILKRL